MIQVRRSAERGKADHGWLKSFHTFSFADYHDPQHMGFRSLRVMNEDRVQPSKGFGAHPHRDMEILTYVISGQLAHQDSMGNARTIQMGELQAMSAGSGVTHSEQNPSPTDPVHFLQIWILPHTKNLRPSYAEWKPQTTNSSEPLSLLASPTAAVKIHQDVSLYLGNLQPSQQVSQPITPGRYLWLQLISGELQLNNQTIHAGDGVAFSNEANLKLQSTAHSKFLIFDLA